ncbi:MAG: hypothetical protein JXK05_09005 [Campylobacterales bacterium]|nr:hypothetical protein [Campylobacterales bacterium]
MEALLTLFNPLPGNRYLLTTTHTDALVTLLAQKLAAAGGALHVITYPGEHLPITDAHLQQSAIGDFATLFRALPREHDFVILQELYSRHAYSERLLRHCYTTLANTAYVLIIEPKGRCDPQALCETLERLEFRVPNVIDVLEGFDVVMAKKMHMWGNGL